MNRDAPDDSEPQSTPRESPPDPDRTSWVRRVLQRSKLVRYIIVILAPALFSALTALISEDRAVSSILRRDVVQNVFVLVASTISVAVLSVNFIAKASRQKEPDAITEIRMATKRAYRSGLKSAGRARTARGE